MNSLNLSTLLLLAGLLMLLSNVSLSAARLRRGQMAGLLNVGLALTACAAVTVGVVRLTMPQPTDAVTASVAALTGASDVASANAASANAASVNGAGQQSVSAKAADSGSRSVPSAAEVTAMAGGSVPDPLKTAAASGKAPAVMMTAAAQEQSGTTKANAVGSGASAGLTASDPLAASINRLALPAAAAGAVVVSLAGLFLFWRERQRPDFNPSNSHGLLSLGAGLFTVVVVLVIPMLSTTPVSAQAGGTAAASGAAQATGTTAPRVARSATPSTTPVPSLTPTEPPTLTPAGSETPIVLYTQIAYTSTYAADTTTNCTVTALTMLNLRGDPSLDNQAIGRVFAGSLLAVTGQSPDKKWWRVVNDDLGSRVEGWVSADYVKADAACFDNSVPIIGPTSASGPSAGTAVTVTMTATKAAAAAVLSATPSATPSAVPTSTPAPTQIVSVENCTVMTISAASLRAGPAISYLILGQVPDRSALTANQKTTDSAWLHVTDATLNGITGTKEGWINASLVMASAACQGLAPVTLTPKAS